MGVCVPQDSHDYAVTYQPRLYKFGRLSMYPYNTSLLHHVLLLSLHREHRIVNVPGKQDKGICHFTQRKKEIIPFLSLSHNPNPNCNTKPQLTIWLQATADDYSALHCL